MSISPKCASSRFSEPENFQPVFLVPDPFSSGQGDLVPPDTSRPRLSPGLVPHTHGHGPDGRLALRTV